MTPTSNADATGKAGPGSQGTDSIGNEVLVAEDQQVSLRLLVRDLTDWGFRVRTAVDGEEALEILESDSAPPVAIIDWNMPKMDGLTVCSRVRDRSDRPYTYLLMLTARNKVTELTKGFVSGADDFVSKPYDPDELRARIRVGQRVATLERTLQARITHLKAALAQVKTLKSLLPICMYCKRIRDDQEYWQELEVYIQQSTGTGFTHGVCPKCFDDFFNSPEAKGMPGT